MNPSTITQVENFVREAFRKNPAYSFGDGGIMYDHSVKVKDLALLIASNMDCDRELLAVEALLHDIGKAYPADAQTLHERHEELGFEAAVALLPQLPLTSEQAELLSGFLRGNINSVEAEIVKDADTVAFFEDERLQRALAAWAQEQGLAGEMQRKADKFKNLKFKSSRNIALPSYEAMKKRWGLV
ncbi:MAG: HD domain-containing protein [Patescibacteria group bacterium]|nr:HD domain-containing protein [Patescibacteria group bacterium]